MRLARLLVLFCFAVFLAGCGSPEERAAAHLESAQELFDEGDTVAAKLEAQNAAQIEPKNAQARYLLALIAEKDGKGREMLQHLQVAVESDPQMLEARIKLGTLYVFARAFDLAIEQLVAAEKLAPDNADVKVLSARLWIQEGDTEKGLAKLNEALDLDPDHVEAIGMKAMTLQENEPDQALALLDEAIKRLPADKSRALLDLKLNILSRHQRTADLEQALLAAIRESADDSSPYRARLARFYREQGRLDEAESMLRDIAAAASGDVGPKLAVVQFLAEARSSGAAIDALQSFVDADPENQQLILALGDLLLNNDRRDEAVAAYEKVAALDPVSESGLLARVKLAAERLANGDTDGARDRVESILADSPAYPRALLIRAGLRFTGQRYDDAIADLRVLLRKEPDHQRALLLMARSEVAAGNPVLARDAYRRLLSVNPNHVAAIRELVALMLQEGNDEEAHTLLSRLSENGNGSIEAGILLIEMLAEQKDWDNAEAEARRFAAATDAGGAGTYMLGQVLEGQQRYADAAEAYAGALQKNPGNIAVLQGLARTLNAQGKKDEAIDLLRRSVAEYPDRAGIQLMLGGALMDLGKTSEARKVFEAVISHHPEFAPVYVAVASLYPDNADKRMAEYRRGLAAIPGNLPLGRLLADEYQRAGKTDELIGLYQALLDAHPNAWEIANNLAGLLADYRYRDPASLERAVQLADGLADTENPAVMDTVGWVYYRAGDSDRAVSFLERAVAALDAIPVVHYHLGMAYLAAGNRIDAKRELARAIQSAVSDFDGIEEARKALASLE